MAGQVELSFGGLLRQLRDEATLTQEELAEKAGLSRRSVSDLERGINRTARKDTALLLAGALDLDGPVRDLFIAAALGRVPAIEVLAAAQGAIGEGGPGAFAPGGGLVWQGCPYLGLMPFQEQDARVFYGRGEVAAQLAQRLQARLNEAGILLVAGESGAGKSSLLRAGLMPRLAAGALGPESERWPRRVFQPGDSPLRELAMQLANVAQTDPVSVYRSLLAAPGEAPMLVDLALRTDAGHRAQTGPAAPGDAAACVPPRLILVVDQFEELFTTGGNDGDGTGPQEREAFITALHAAATLPVGPQKLPRALVVAAVRADFLGRLIANPPLKAAVEAGLFTVGPMSEAELRIAVTGPAAEAGLGVEPAVVEAVTAELREGADGRMGGGVLPLMSQAMAATWEHREDNALTLRAYRRAGGVADAVNRSAQAAYDGLTGGQKDAARLIFTQLTLITPDGQFARRRCSRTDLRFPDAHMAADTGAVIDIFSARRLLVLGKDGVEISHDTLLHSWKQLRDWLTDDQADRGLYSQVVTDAQTWEINGRDSSYLYRAGRLATIDAAASRWQEAPTRYPPLPATGEAFLRAAHRAASRSAQRRHAVVAALLALTVIALSAAGIAVRDAANASRQHAIALSRQLAAESLAIDSSDPSTARRLAVAAWRIFPTSQARSLLTALLTEQQQGGILAGEPSGKGVTSVAFSPNGTLLATADTGGNVRLWNPATGQAVGTALPADNPADYGGYSVAFSPDGKLLATAGVDGTVRLWNPATRQPVGAPLRAGSGLGGVVLGVAFSPDGTLLAAADGDGTVRLWNPATRQPVGAPLRTHTSAASAPMGGVGGVAFSPDGTLLATADAGGTVQLWNPATRQPVGAPFRAGSGLGGTVNAMAFSPDGTLLATADADGTVRLWNPATRQPVGAPLRAATGPGSAVGAVAFSPNGTLLAAADADGTVRLWNPATRRAPRAPVPADTRPGNAVGGGVIDMAFSPGSKLLATVDADGTVRLWNPATGQLAGAPLRPHPGTGEVAFSPDGVLLATDENGTVWLWNTATRRAIGAPLRPDPFYGIGGSFDPGLLGLAFSPNGKLLARAAENGLVWLWNPATGQASGAPLHAYPGGVTRVAFSPDGTLLATADADGTVQLWDVATRRPAGTPLRAHRGAGNLVSEDLVSEVAFSPDGTLLATVGADGTVQLWDVATRRPAGTPLRAHPGTGDLVSEVAFSPNGKLLATAGADGTVRLWNPATGRQTGKPLPADTGLGGGVTAVAFSPDGTLLATAGADGTVRLWQMSLFADPYAALCTDVGPPTKADWRKYAPGESQPSVCG